MNDVLRSQTSDDRQIEWLVYCPGNDRLVTYVRAPIQPHYCPTCGKYAKAVKPVPKALAATKEV